MTAATFTAAQLARMTLDQCDSWYRQGVITQDQYEAYRHVWATSAAHSGYSHAAGWTDSDFAPAVLAIAAEIRAAVSS